MKANETPKKIYLHPNLDSIFGMAERSCESEIEYTRTDAFIEKAKQWLRKNADNYTWYDETEGKSGMTDEFVDDFVNYMKGE